MQLIKSFKALIQRNSSKKLPVLNRLEETKMKEIIYEIDANPFVAVYDVMEVKGGNFKKKDIH